MALAASYLSNLFSSLSGGTDPLLATLYGTGGAAGAGSPTPVAALSAAEQNQASALKVVAADPAVSLALKRFTAGVMAAKTPQDLLSNPAVLDVLLTANGLGDQAAYGALARKALLSDPSSRTALVNTLADTRWKGVAATYQFATKGVSVIQTPAVLRTLTAAYTEIKWRQSLDAATPGLSNALTFRAGAGSIKSVDQILGDPVLRAVVTTALGVPKEIAFQSLAAQEKAISSRLDITKFQDKTFVESFVKRYLVNNASQTSGISTGSDLSTLALQAAGLVA